jgi:predicted enzyme related to lactoylglutathione lyase
MSPERESENAAALSPDRKKRQDIALATPLHSTTRRLALDAMCSRIVRAALSMDGFRAGTRQPGRSGRVFQPLWAEWLELQRFYADVFDWKVAANGDVATTVTPPLTGTIAQGVTETIIYVGVADGTATLQKVVDGGGTIRYPRFEVPGRVILGVFKDPAGNSVGLVEIENGKAKVPPSRRPGVTIDICPAPSNHRPPTTYHLPPTTYHLPPTTYQPTTYHQPSIW